MVSVFSNIVPDPLTFRPVDECFFESLYDLLQVLVKRFFRTIIVDKVFDNVAREFIDPGIYGVGLVDNLSLKNDFALLIHVTIPIFAAYKSFSGLRSCALLSIGNDSSSLWVRFRFLRRARPPSLPDTHFGSLCAWHPQGPIHPQPSPVPLHFAWPTTPSVDPPRRRLGAGWTLKMLWHGAVGWMWGALVGARSLVTTGLPPV